MKKVFILSDIEGVSVLSYWDKLKPNFLNDDPFQKIMISEVHQI